MDVRKRTNNSGTMTKHCECQMWYMQYLVIELADFDNLVHGILCHFTVSHPFSPRDVDDPSLGVVRDIVVTARRGSVLFVGVRVEHKRSNARPESIKVNRRKCSISK
jgi:hypothetical protein